MMSLSGCFVDILTFAPKTANLLVLLRIMSIYSTSNDAQVTSVSD